MGGLRAGRSPASRAGRRQRDLASGFFLLAVALNTAALVSVNSVCLGLPLVALQALLMLGCQEAKHLAVHRSFLSHRLINDAVGNVCAALHGVNFAAYRQFHYRHHMATCDDDDPEGCLYRLSWRTRWLWAAAPFEVFYVAIHLNRAGRGFVPAGKRMAHRWSTACVLACASGLLLLAGFAPHAFVWAYALPLAVSTWIDFMLTQSEHYSVPIAAPGTRRSAATLTLDLLLPPGLGWLMLHRSLHRVHHCQPAGNWTTALRRLHDDSAAAPMSYAAFARRWLRDGPRLWTGPGVFDGQRSGPARRSPVE